MTVPTIRSRSRRSANVASARPSRPRTSATAMRPLPRDALDVPPAGADRTPSSSSRDRTTRLLFDPRAFAAASSPGWLLCPGLRTYPSVVLGLHHHYGVLHRAGTSASGYEGSLAPPRSSSRRRAWTASTTRAEPCWAVPRARAHVRHGRHARAPRDRALFVVGAGRPAARRPSPRRSGGAARGSGSWPSRRPSTTTSRTSSSRSDSNRGRRVRQVIRAASSEALGAERHRSRQADGPAFRLHRRRRDREQRRQRLPRTRGAARSRPAGCARGQLAQRGRRGRRGRGPSDLLRRPTRDASGNVRLADVGPFLRDRIQDHLARGIDASSESTRAT